MHFRTYRNGHGSRQRAKCVTLRVAERETTACTAQWSTTIWWSATRKGDAGGTPPEFIEQSPTTRCPQVLGSRMEATVRTGRTKVNSGKKTTTGVRRIVGTSRSIVTMRMSLVYLPSERRPSPASNVARGIINWRATARPNNDRTQFRFDVYRRLF